MKLFIFNWDPPCPPFLGGLSVGFSGGPLLAVEGPRTPYILPFFTIKTIISFLLLFHPFFLLFAGYRSPILLGTSKGGPLVTFHCAEGPMLAISAVEGPPDTLHFTVSFFFFLFFSSFFPVFLFFPLFPLFFCAWILMGPLRGPGPRCKINPCPPPLGGPAWRTQRTSRRSSMKILIISSNEYQARTSYLS